MGNVSGVLFYEVNIITANAVLAGGEGTDLRLRASNYITLNVGFEADASTGAKFRAWIGPCNSGGIFTYLVPEINQWISETKNNYLLLHIEKDKATFKVNMPFDAKASLAAFDEKWQLKEVFLNNVMLTKGNNNISIDGTTDWAKRKIVLLVDGQVAGIR